LVDGFPRNKENFDGFLKFFGDSAKIKSVLFLELAQETCVERITLRSKNSGRVDDNQETLKKRFDVFFDETIGNLVNLEKVTQVIRVDADGDKETVFQRASVELDKLFPKN
jgi:UMP-CMP kinase